MILYDSDVASPSPVVVRLFVHERGGLTFEAKVIALSNLENRSKSFVQTVNPRGEVPALRLDNGHVLTETIAICEYLDEIAQGGQSLIGHSAEERAISRSWTRWLDIQIVQACINWFRGTDMAVDFYIGHRVLFRQGQSEVRQLAERALNELDIHLDGRDFICAADRPMLPDILLFATILPMYPLYPWMNAPGRNNVASWVERMKARPASDAAISSFSGSIAV